MIKERLNLPLLLVGPLTTLAVSPTFNSDPINLIKVFILTILSFYCFGLLISNNPKNLSVILPKSLVIATSFFIFFLFTTLVLSGAPFNQQIWGTFGRSTGLVTYVSLSFLMLCITSMQDKKFYLGLLKALIVVSIPLDTYCLLQMANMDPVNWSFHDTFATLGNVNFLSAFLGISSIAFLYYAIFISKNALQRFILLIVTFAQLAIAFSTNSIQGPLAFLAGVGISFYFWLAKFKKRIFNWSYILAGLIGFVLTLLAVLNKGPLARLIYQETIVFRSDYMHAGWAMTLKRPFYGVGLDSYGDWYRQLRGQISTLRTGPDRTANTAHNIFLDISSNGGFPLFTAYVAITGLVIVYFIRRFRQYGFDPIHTTFFGMWFAYQIQALVSINQIGVGVWGWIFSGAIIGYSRIEPTTENNNKTLSKSSRRKVRNGKAILSPAGSITTYFVTLIGFLIAFIPLKADMNFRHSSDARNLTEMMKMSTSLGANSWHVSNTIQAAMQSNYPDQAKKLDEFLIRNYPREFYGWKVRYALYGANSRERIEAIQNMELLDPFNPDIPKS